MNNETKQMFKSETESKNYVLFIVSDYYVVAFLRIKTIADSKQMYVWCKICIKFCRLKNNLENDLNGTVIPRADIRMYVAMLT